MNKPLKFKFGDEILTEVDIIKKAYDHAKEYPPEIRKKYLDTISETFSNNSMNSKFQSIYLPTFGVIFLIVILVVCYFNPFPSLFQSGVYWVVLSLAAATCAALIPGFIEFQYQGVLRAGGAIAVFCLMYFFSPNIIKQVGPESQDKITLYVVQDTADILTLHPEFDRNSQDRLLKILSTSINSYLGTNLSYTDFTFYRRSDGKIYRDEVCYDVTEMSLLIIPNNIVKKCANKHQAYLKFNKLVDME